MRRKSAITSSTLGLGGLAARSATSSICLMVAGSGQVGLVQELPAGGLKRTRACRRQLGGVLTENTARRLNDEIMDFARA